LFSERKISEQQKRGLIVCTSKTARPTLRTDFRLITLLNTDYKLLVRIIASRLRPTLVELLHPIQYCGVPGKTIFEAVATVRITMSYAEVEQIPYVSYHWISRKHSTGYRTRTASPY
jgi:hypothetical protein